MSAHISTNLVVKLSKYAPFDIVAEATKLTINTTGGSISITFDDIKTMTKLGDAVKEAIDRIDRKEKMASDDSAAEGSDSDDDVGDEEDDLIGAIQDLKPFVKNDDSFEADEVIESQQLFF